ncbi:hypothetical protein XENOCAPTIV_009165 [Xenoophorus captivus]|uniref:Uncharacterized protein n=1 Tax=Xenoophorus captivus TaxID=1517983 RepID=A0ABV0Q8Y3_9TELE
MCNSGGELDLNSARCLFKLNVPSSKEQLSTELLGGFLISCPRPHTHTHTQTHKLIPHPNMRPHSYCNSVKLFLRQSDLYFNNGLCFQGICLKMAPQIICQNLFFSGPKIPQHLLLSKTLSVL